MRQGLALSNLLLARVFTANGIHSECWSGPPAEVFEFPTAFGGRTLLHSIIHAQSGGNHLSTMSLAVQARPGWQQRLPPEQLYQHPARVVAALLPHHLTLNALGSH